MQTLEILQKIANIKKLVVALMNGNASAYEVEEELAQLSSLLSELSELPVKIKKSRDNSHKKDEIKEVSLDFISKNSLFLNSSNRLLYKIEEDDKGVALQEAHGYVIFVANKDLHQLKPVTTVKDPMGLLWTLEPTDNELVVRAVNDIGDIINGMKAVQELIDGTETMEVK